MVLLVARDLEGVLEHVVRKLGRSRGSDDGARSGAADVGSDQALSSDRAKVELSLEVLQVEREVEDVGIVATAATVAVAVATLVVVVASATGEEARAEKGSACESTPLKKVAAIDLAVELVGKEGHGCVP